MDTRSPFVIGIHDIARRPGTQRTLDLEIPAPKDLAIDVIGVPEGAPMRLDLRVDSVVEGILISGDITAPLAGECVRCLGPVQAEHEVTFTELFAYPGALEREDDDDEADDLYEVTGDSIDIEQVVRDAVVLALPFQPRCRVDCKGLCSVCGIDLNSAPEDHHHEMFDARWAALVAAYGSDGDHPGQAAENSPAAESKDVP